MADLAAAAAQALAAGPAALVTVLATEGSAPRGAGTRMLVTAEGQAGTIGGGALEWQAAAQARAILAHPAGTWRVQDYPLGPLLGQCCGGRVRLLVERLAGAEWLAGVEAGEVVEAWMGEEGVERRSLSLPRVASLPRPAFMRHLDESRGRLGESAAPAESDPCFSETSARMPTKPQTTRHPGLVPGSTSRHDQRLPLLPKRGCRNESGMTEWVSQRSGESADGDGRRIEVMSARGPLPAAGTRYVEPLDAPRSPVLLFGAGHVGRAIAALMPGLPLALAWYDSRPEADAPGVCVDGEDALVACAGGAGADSAVLILTHDHALDYRLCAAALRSPARFVGLIGSATKRARFVSRLAAEGVDPARLVCPIGIAGIAGKEPAVIALAAVAQLLALGPAA